MKKNTLLGLLLFAVSCSNDNNNVLQRLNEAPATVREVQGANGLFVFELPNNSNGLYSAYIVPSPALPAEYKEDGLSVLISGDVTNNFVAIDGYISEDKGNTITLDGLYNTVEIRTMSVQDQNLVKYIKTILGGCNTDATENLRSSDLQEDKVSFYATTDSIRVFVGINYTCSAPFETRCIIENNTVRMYITDVCEDASSCYDRCDCYYTFEFIFERTGKINYKYVVELISPMEGKSKILSEGNLETN